MHIIKKILRLILSKPKISIITVIIAIFYIGLKFNIAPIIVGFTILIALFTMFYSTKEALKNLGDCLFYLLFMAPMISSLASIFALEQNILPNYNYSYIVFALIYLCIWVLIITFGDLKTVKLATLIIAQGVTALYLVVSMVINFIPVSSLNEIYTSFTPQDLKFMYDEYEITQKGLLKICMEILIYPSLITALLTYLIAEIRGYRLEKQMKY